MSKNNRKYKVLVFGKSKRRMRTNYYFLRGFRNLGHKAKWLKYQKVRRFLGKKLGIAFCKWYFNRFAPDFVYLDAADIPMELLSYIREKCPVFIYYDDCVLGTKYPDKMVRYGREAGKFYITAKGEVSYWQDKGVNCAYLPGGVDEDYHFISPPPGDRYESDVAFIGRPNTEERIEFIRLLSEKFDMKIWGKGWDKHGIEAFADNAYPSDYTKICRGAKVMIGWNIDASVELYFSNRTWFSIGSGACYLTRYCPKLEEMFDRGKHLDWFETPEEGVEKVQYYLDHPEKREIMRKEGHKLAHEKYSFTVLAQHMVEDFEELRSAGG